MYFCIDTLIISLILLITEPITNMGANSCNKAKNIEFKRNINYTFIDIRFS